MSAFTVVHTAVDAKTVRAIEAQFQYVMAVRALIVPLYQVRLPSEPRERAELHPIRRVQLAMEDEELQVPPVDVALAMPLARAEVCAAYLAYDWWPDKYEYAIEQAGRLLSAGVDPRRADVDAIKAARKRFAIPSECATCRHFKAGASMRIGVCTRFDRGVSPTTPAPSSCYEQGFTDDMVSLAHRPASPRVPIAG